MLRNWQRPGAGRGAGGQEGGGVGRRDGNREGETDKGNWDREMGRGETGNGRGRGNREGEKGQEVGGFTDGMMECLGGRRILGLSNCSKQIECLGRQGCGIH